MKSAKITAVVAVLVVATIVLAGDRARAQVCDCTQYPFEPPECHDVCFSQVLNSVSAATLTGTLGVSEETAQSYIEFRTQKQAGNVLDSPRSHGDNPEEGQPIDPAFAFDVIDYKLSELSVEEWNELLTRMEDGE